MKKKLLKAGILAATLLWMILIFWFSAQPADESTEMSNGIGYFIGQIMIPEFRQLPAEQQQQYVESIDHTVRKCAHATEYLILGILCTATLLVWFSRIKKTFRKQQIMLFLLGWLIAVLYAVSDEIHQIFIPGRACMFSDILIDSAGITAGVLLLWLIRVLLSEKRS